MFDQREDSCPVTSLVLAISCSSISCPCESPCSTPMNADGNPAQLLQSRAGTFVPLHFQRAGSIVQPLHSHAEFLLHRMVDTWEPLLKPLRPLEGATVHPPCFPSCTTNNSCHFCSNKQHNQCREGLLSICVLPVSCIRDPRLQR